MARIRAKEIRQRRQRKKRIGKLKEKLANAKTIKEREHLIDLIQRRQPLFDPEKEE